jgi:hypothetical protein
MKTVSPSRSLLVAATIFAPAVGHGALVFSDDFSEPAGTLIDGKAADIGGPWSETGGGTVSAAGTFDTTGAARTAFGGFTSALGAGQVLTLSYDTFALGNFFSGGYAGVSLYVGDSEQLFTGDLGSDTVWGVAQAVVGGEDTPDPGGDATGETSATFTYDYDSGAWTFTTLAGVDMSGTGLPGAAFDQLRVANGSGGDINVDNITVDISAVPEPSIAVLSGLALASLGMRRRR